MWFVGAWGIGLHGLRYNYYRILPSIVGKLFLSCSQLFRHWKFGLGRLKNVVLDHTKLMKTSFTNLFKKIFSLIEKFTKVLIDWSQITSVTELWIWIENIDPKRLTLLHIFILFVPARFTDNSKRHGFCFQKRNKFSTKDLLIKKKKE